MAYGSTKSISDSILSATDGESIQEEIDVYMQSTASGTTGDGLIAAATINKNTDAAVTAMRRKSLGARKSQATAQETVRRDKLASVGRDWTALLMGVEEEDAPINATLRSDMMAKEASRAPQTANEAYLQGRELPTDGDRPDVLTPDGSDNISGSGASEAEGRFDDEPATTTTTPATTSLMSRPTADNVDAIEAYKTEVKKITQAQTTLTDLGFKPNGIDGKLGGGTRRAIRKFQKANGLGVTGQLDLDTVGKINSGNAVAYPDPPKPNAEVEDILPADFDIFKTEIGKIESSNRYNIMGGAYDHYVGRYQMGKDALKDVGRGYNDKLNKALLNNPKEQDKLFKAYTTKNHKHLTKNSQAYRDMSPQEKLGILGYAHNQGATAAEEYLFTGIVGTDANDTKGTKYTDALAKAFEGILSISLRPQARP